MGENTKKPNMLARIGKFFREVRGEMKKVIWPTWKQVVNNTLIVIAFIILVGIVLAIIDAIFSLGVLGVIFGDFKHAMQVAFPFLTPR